MTSADPVTVNATELVGAFDCVSAGAPGETCASIGMDTGRTSWTSIAADGEEEDLPADLATSDRSIEVLHKHDLGRDLALACAAQALPGAPEAVEDCCRRQDASGRFKHLLEVRGAREKWGACEDRATQEALRNWCEATSMRRGEG